MKDVSEAAELFATFAERYGLAGAVLLAVVGVFGYAVRQLWLDEGRYARQGHYTGLRPEARPEAQVGTPTRERHHPEESASMKLKPELPELSKLSMDNDMILITERNDALAGLRAKEHDFAAVRMHLDLMRQQRQEMLVVLREISNWTKAAHAHDAELGHELRPRDGDMVEAIETFARGEADRISELIRAEHGTG